METNYNHLGVRKGAWTKEEDDLLRQCIQNHGDGKWHQVPYKAGLNRCRKSCRLRWLNYLKPNIKRGSFTEDEVDLMIRLHKLLGNRWSLIAGRLPGRTANDVKNYWNSRLRQDCGIKKMKDNLQEARKTTVIKPQARTLMITSNSFSSKESMSQNIHSKDILSSPTLSHTSSLSIKNGNDWWNTLLDDQDCFGLGDEQLFTTCWADEALNWNDLPINSELWNHSEGD